MVVDIYSSLATTRKIYLKRVQIAKILQIKFTELQGMYLWAIYINGLSFKNLPNNSVTRKPFKLLSYNDFIKHQLYTYMLLITK